MSRRESYVGPARRTRLRITPRGMVAFNLVLAFILAAGIGAVTLAMLNLGSDPLPACSSTTTGPCSGLPPCPTEDSTDCYWDADTMGNGQGHDVVMRDGVGQVMP